MDSARFPLNKEAAEAKRVNQPVYRIGNKDPITGLYEVLDGTGAVIGYGNKIFNNTFEYGDVVRATKPYGSAIWALDKIDIIAKKASEPPNPTTPPSPPTPPDPPSPTPPSNGFPVSPPSTDSPTPPSGGGGNPPKQPDPPPNCDFPPSGCHWQDASIPCNGKIQDYDYAILNTGTLVLCCDPSVTPPANGGCTPYGYSCVNGACVPSRGAGASLAQCQASLIPPPYTGGQLPGVLYRVDCTYVVNGNIGYGSIGSLLGPISDIYFTPDFVGSGAYNIFISTGTGLQTVTLAGGIGSFGQGAVTGVVREDGLPYDKDKPPRCP